jgi:hypothetical protein
VASILRIANKGNLFFAVLGLATMNCLCAAGSPGAPPEAVGGIRKRIQ